MAALLILAALCQPAPALPETTGPEPIVAHVELILLNEIINDHQQRTVYLSAWSRTLTHVDNSPRKRLAWTHQGWLTYSDQTCDLYCVPGGGWAFRAMRGERELILHADRLEWVSSYNDLECMWRGRGLPHDPLWR